MERLQDLLALTFFLYYKTFALKSRKLTTDVIGFVSKNGKLFTESLVGVVLKCKKRSKFITRRDRTFFTHSYEYSCRSTPQSSQSFRSRIKNGYKFLPCLSAKALDVESDSAVILPPDVLHGSTAYYNNSGVILAIEGPPQTYDSPEEQKYSSASCDEFSGALVPIEDASYSPAGSPEETCRGRMCHATKFSCNCSGTIFAMDSLWSPIRSRAEKCTEPDIDWLAEEFIQGFYKKLREQIY